MGVCCANRQEICVGNGATNNQKSDPKKEEGEISSLHSNNKESNKDIFTGKTIDKESEFFSKLDELEAKSVGDKKKSLNNNSTIIQARTVIKNTTLNDITKRPTSCYKKESVLEGISEYPESPQKISEKNLNKTSTIKHNKYDFNVKPKISKGQQSLQKAYYILSKLGKGSFGTVFKVVHKNTGQFRAMKVIKKDTIQLQDDEREFLKEIEILKNTDHMSIIKIYEYYEDDINFYIITEFAAEGELLENIVKFPNFDESFVRRIMKQIMSAVTYLHKINITHRDLKPENILVSGIKENDMDIKVIDFGTSNYVQKNKNLKLKVGSPYYIAPEVLQGSYNEKCDIWSCGVILYVLLVGYPPFNGDSTKDLFEAIKKGNFIMEGFEWDVVSREAKDMVKKMLTKNFHSRPTAQQCIEHEWMQKDQDNNINKEFKNVLKNLSNLHHQDKLQQATVAYIVHFLTPSSEFDQLKETFKSLDKNGDGTLSLDEIKAGFEKLFGSVTGEVEVEKILEEVDIDGDGTISYEEFLNIVINKAKVINEKNLQLCFESFDSNKDNKLSAEEIRKALGAKDNEYVKELIGLIDENNNSEIDFEEFKALMNVLVKHEAVKK